MLCRAHACEKVCPGGNLISYFPRIRKRLRIKHKSQSRLNNRKLWHN